MAKKAATIEAEQPPQTEQPAETAPTQEVPVQASAAAEVPVHPGFEWLNTAPADEILKHPRFGGILGQRMQEERERVRKEINAENEQKARDKIEREMQELANDDPLEFSRRWLSAKEQERIRDQETTLRDGVRKDFATKIGETLQTIPEWHQLTPDEFSRLQQAVAGKSDDDALGAFNLAALDIIAERKSVKRVEEFRSKELAKEREAIRAEEAAKALQNSPRPDLARGSQPAPFDPTKLSDKDFDQWYRKERLGRI